MKKAFVLQHKVCASLIQSSSLKRFPTPVTALNTGRDFMPLRPHIQFQILSGLTVKLSTVTVMFHMLSRASCYPSSPIHHFLQKFKATMPIFPFLQKTHDSSSLDILNSSYGFKKYLLVMTKTSPGRCLGIKRVYEAPSCKWYQTFFRNTSNGRRGKRKWIPNKFLNQVSPCQITIWHGNAHWFEEIGKRKETPSSRCNTEAVAGV